MRALFFLIPALFVAGCSSSDGDDQTKVATSVYAVQFITEQIGGDHVEVVNVTPPGAEPHDVELGSDEVIQMAEADLVVYVGGDFQPAVEEALDEVESPTIDALEASGGVVGTDPHFWLDPTRLATVVDEVSAQLGEVAPEHAEDFSAAGEDLRGRLEELDDELHQGLLQCGSRDIVVSHEAFGFLADRYNLTQVGIAGLDPETEPSPQRIADAADFVRKNNVTTVFFETLLPPDAAETIAREVGVKTSSLDPLESAPESGDYFTTMASNLENLQQALGC